MSTLVTTVPVPPRMRHLPCDPRGYPIPWLAFRDRAGRAHFTINEEPKRLLCLIEDLCPICGRKLLARRWFAGGPLSAFHPNGVYADPPMHGECVHYALRVCPWLAASRYERRIDRGTLKDDDPSRVFLDRTQQPERPVLFVAVLAAGQSLRRPEFYVMPNRPFLRVEYWHHGVRLKDRAALTKDPRLAKLVLLRDHWQPR